MIKLCLYLVGFAYVVFMMLLVGVTIARLFRRTDRSEEGDV